MQAKWRSHKNAQDLQTKMAQMQVQIDDLQISRANDTQVQQAIQVSQPKQVNGMSETSL